MKKMLIRSYHSTGMRYKRLLNDLIKHGTQVQVGPEMTTEISPFVAKFLKPEQRLIDPPGRNLNFAYCVVEALDILMNKNPGLAPKFVKRLENWMVDGKFPGHYGERFAATKYNTNPVFPGLPVQLTRCYWELLKRPTSRRATLTVHNPTLEEYTSKDVACTMDLQFLIRDEKLHCIAHMRSNDALWGFCYDTWLFQFLQESMASWLQVDLGHYYHFAGSLHYYHNRHKAVEKIISRSDEKYKQDAPIPMGPMKIEIWADTIATMWNTTQYYINYPDALDTAILFVWAVPEPFRSYQFAILEEIARKRRLGEICKEIYKKMPKSDVRQWVKRRCKID